MRSVWLTLVLAACTASGKEVQPTGDSLFFPTGAAVSPDERFLFVANANSELRFDSGTVGVIDLEHVDRTVTAWETSGALETGCHPDPDHRETLYCEGDDPPDKNGDKHGERPFMLPGSATRIGNFATKIAIQDTGNGTLRLIVPTRGDPSITWIDFDGARLECNADAQGLPLCDEAHRLSYVHNDPDLAIVPDEPFDAYADSTGQFAIVTHLTTGAVTLVDSPVGNNAVVADVMTGVFAADPLTGLRGSTGVSARPSPSGDIIYVGSRSEPRIQTLTVGRPVNSDVAPPYLLAGNYFFLHTVGGLTGGSQDTRGIAFSSTGDRMYLINRKPPSLQVFDTSLGPTGFPRNAGIGATDICRQASTLAVMDAGDGDRAYVTCFQDGLMYIVDPRGLSSVENIVTVGRGPYSVVVAPNKKKVFITNFLEDTIAVLDANPTSPYYNRIVMRIGDQRPL